MSLGRMCCRVTGWVDACTEWHLMHACVSTTTTTTTTTGPVSWPCKVMAGPMSNPA